MKRVIAMLLAVGGCGLCLAGARAENAPPGHPFLAADYSGGKISIVSAGGKVEWNYPAPNTTDVWLLPNGDILFSWLRGVKEVTRDKKVVWEYQSAGGNEVYACQRLPNGDTLVGELGPCRLVEVGPDGQIRKTVKVPTNVGQHMQFRNARKLPNGHYLVACTGDGAVKELDGDGNVTWATKLPGSSPFSAVRLPNGNTLIGWGDGHRVSEVDKEGKTVWEIQENELPGIPLRFVAGVERLPNGNTVFCNWLGHGHIGDGTHVVEVTPDKKVVWSNADHQAFKTMTSIVLLDVKGDVPR